MSKRAWVAGLVGLAALGLAGVVPAAAAGFTVTPSVVSQTCLNRDTVQVTLTATTTSSSPVKYVWDFNNDRKADTAPSSNPTVTTVFGDEERHTVNVGAQNQQRERAFGSITFQTIRCS